MEKSHKIALLGAGLLIGAQVSATILTETPDAALQEPVAAEVEGEGASTPDIAEAAPAPDAAPEPLAVAEQPILPVTPRQVEPQGTPPWGEDYRRMLPSLAEYLDRTEHLRVTGAPGGAFPSDGARMLPSLAEYLDSTEHLRVAGAPGGAFPSDGARMLPSLAAYLEQREAARVQPAVAGGPIAGEPVASAATPASGSEVTLVEAPSPLTAGTPF
jgi:hypothetical protein